MKKTKSKKEALSLEQLNKVAGGDTGDRVIVKNQRGELVVVDKALAEDRGMHIVEPYNPSK